MDVTTAADTLLQRATAALLARRRSPCATYRLQFHSGFTFRDATAVVGYLARLGISDAYASPYLKARPGSRHGYDIFDHRKLNPEIGTEEEYDAWINELHRHKLGQLFDMVPNHMGIVGNGNPWWEDVLENGRASAHAEFFDIDWEPIKAGLRGRVLLPVLGDPYGKSLEAGQIKLAYENGTFSVHYFDHRFPLDPRTYNRILSRRPDVLAGLLGEGSDSLIEYQSIQTAISHLPSPEATEPAKTAERRREKEVVKRRLAALTESSPVVRSFVQENVALFNGVGNGSSFDLLDELLNDQAYRLAWWRVAADEINYRRFFDINELAALRMEREDVFDAAHELVLRLLLQGKVDGLRIDHPDGLFDPKQYLDRLQEAFVVETARQIAASEAEFASLDWNELRPAVREAWRRALADPNCPQKRPLYVVVEKILARDESLRDDWATDGTTGYKFLNTLNGLFVQRDNSVLFDRLYRHWAEGEDASGEILFEGSFRDVVYAKKFQTMQVALSGELHVLGQQLDRLSDRHRWSRDFTQHSLRHALREVIACFDVYRSYITGPDVNPVDRLLIDRAVVRARRRNPVLNAALFDYIRDMLLLRRYEEAGPEERGEQLRFVGHFQQVTSPVMAKGLEDTAFYVYNRLISLNEVGGDPEYFGISVEAFHERMLYRREHASLSLSATATHDTKRGEDVRARLNVLSEIPEAWRRVLARWGRRNRKHRQPFEDGGAPDRNDEYLFYQTLVGAWPMADEGPEGHTRFVERIQEYMLKAVHEAKVHTSWINPNPAYDQAVSMFVARVLDAKSNVRFLDDLRAFSQRISHYGVFNSLSQVLFKVAAPGVPDVYQGTELWDLSLVDPDNRRPVDYALRSRMLDDVDMAAGSAGANLPAFVRSLAERPHDGRVKLYLLSRALRSCRDHPALFTIGEYLQATATGERASHVCAFVRRHEGRVAVAVVPRLLTGMIGPDELPVGPMVWDDTRLSLPGVEGRRLRNVLTGEVLQAQGESLLVADVLAYFPVALLLSEG
jgi:(1->4)-alpha-D-glucan 1-alpha-D-glucosylmutase